MTPVYIHTNGVQGSYQYISSLTPFVYFLMCDSCFHQMWDNISLLIFIFSSKWDKNILCAIGHLHTVYWKMFIHVFLPIPYSSFAIVFCGSFTSVLRRWCSEWKWTQGFCMPSMSPATISPASSAHLKIKLLIYFLLKCMSSFLFWLSK